MEVASQHAVPTGGMLNYRMQLLEGTPFPTPVDLQRRPTCLKICGMCRRPFDKKTVPSEPDSTDALTPQAPPGGRVRGVQLTHGRSLKMF